MGSIDPFNRLVKLAARAFYDGPIPQGENQPKTGRGDNRGIGVVVLDALTRRQWVREEDLAKDLKLHTKQLRRTLRLFEVDKLVTRDQRKETAKGAKIYNAAVAATGDSQQTGREGDDKQKMHTHSYCCLDYSQIYDVVRYRLHRMKKQLKDELESKNTVQEYICPNCSKRYTALDALRLISPYDEYFHCESCNGVLESESDKLAVQDLGEGDDNARRRRQENIKDTLARMEIGSTRMMLPIALLRMVQLKPLIDQLARVKDLSVPEFGNLQAWEARARAAGRSANGDMNDSDPSKSSQGFGFGGTPMPYVGETKVEVAFSGIDEKGENLKSENAKTPMKVLPPWMIRDGMSLTKEQRGETKPKIETGGTLKTPEVADDKESTTVNEEKNVQDEYIKAYYAALLMRQHEQEETMNKLELVNATVSTERQVGMKSKRDEDYEGDDVEWEEVPPTGGQTKQFKVYDLNEEAAASEDEEDDIDWEEG